MIRLPVLLLPATLAVSCRSTMDFRDLDQDSELPPTDCDNENPSANSSRPEDLETDFDDDCDGKVNEVDVDEDGYEVLPDGVEGADCDDTDPAVHPEVAEVCHDGKDNNCVPLDCAWSLDEPLTEGDTADQLIRLTGTTAQDQAGYAVLGRAVDGLPQVLVGAPGAEDGAGAVYAVTLDDSRGERGLGSVATRLVGETADELLGTALAASAEGVLALGARGVENVGRVYLFVDVPAGAASVTEADAFVVGQEGDGLGGAVLWLDDAEQRLVLGAPAAGTGAGGVYVVETSDRAGEISLADPSASRRWSSDCKGLRAGTSLAAIPQSDGGDVLAVGAPGGCTATGIALDQGEIALISFAAEVSGEGETLALLPGGEKGELFGTTLAVGDLSGDGYPDLVVGAPGRGSEDGGGLSIYLGSTDAQVAGISLEGEARVRGPDGSGLGGALTLSPDLSDDGRVDLLAGAPDADVDGGSGGQVYLLLSQDLPDVDTSTQIDAIAVPIVPSATLGDAAFGAALGVVPDANGDHAPELLVGAPFGDIAGTNAGAVYVFYGAAE